GIDIASLPRGPTPSGRPSPRRQTTDAASPARLVGRPLQRRVMAERQDDDHRDRGAGRDGGQAPSEVAGGVLDPADGEGAEIAREIAERIDRRDSRRRRGARKDRRRQGPENRKGREDA